MKTAVLIPTFNSARFLAESILSIKEGTTPCDIWVLDGGSEDGTESLAKSYGASFCNWPGMHPAARIDEWLKWNAAAEPASHIAIQHSDDVAMPDRLDNQIRLFEADSSLGCVGGGMMPFWYEPRSANITRDPNICPPTEHNQIFAQLPFWWVMQAPTLMFSIDELRKHPHVGFFNEFKFCNDHLHTFELIGAGMKFANVAEPVVAYRRHYGSDGPRNRKEVASEEAAVKEHILESLGFDTEHFDLHQGIHLEGGPIWQGTCSQPNRPGDWLMSMLRQNSDLGALPEPELTYLVHHIWNRMHHP